MKYITLTRTYRGREINAPNPVEEVLVNPSAIVTIKPTTMVDWNPHDREVFRRIVAEVVLSTGKSMTVTETAYQVQQRAEEATS